MSNVVPLEDAPTSGKQAATKANELQKLANDVYGRIVFHRHLALMDCYKWSWTNRAFRFFIPILSACVLVVGSEKLPVSKPMEPKVVFWIGVSLTALTSLSASWQPSKRSLYFNYWVNRFTTAAQDMRLELLRLNSEPGSSEEKLITLIKVKSAEVSQLIDEYNRNQQLQPNQVGHRSPEPEKIFDH